jgi:hypothetical protein
MKDFARLALLVAGLSGCSSSNPGPYGTWLLLDPTSKTGAAMDIHTDNTYVAALLFLTSSTTANAQVETGTIAVSGDTLTLTPKESTCTGPDPGGSITYAIQDGDLVLNRTDGPISLQPNRATATTAFATTLGCFGTFITEFTPQPLAPVTN